MLIRSADSSSNVAIPFSRRQGNCPLPSLSCFLSLTLDHADVYLHFTRLVSLVILPLNDARRWVGDWSCSSLQDDELVENSGRVRLIHLGIDSGEELRYELGLESGGR
jgi:hypothetical protein